MRLSTAYQSTLFQRSIVVLLYNLFMTSTPGESYKLLVSHFFGKMDKYLSCDDTVVDYHEIDRLKLSLPLDKDFSDGNDQADQVEQIYLKFVPFVAFFY